MIPTSSPFSYYDKACKVALLASHHRPVMRYLIDHGHPPQRLSPRWYHYQLGALCFLAMEDSRDFCKIVRKNRDFVVKELSEKNYQTFLIPKKKGGVRVVSAPGKELALLQRRLNVYLQYYYVWVLSPFVHGFVPVIQQSNQKRTIRTNAKKHVKQNFVLNIDLKDFFSNITSKRVFDLFKSELFGFNELTAATLTELCTYEGSLPTGAPTSPIIGNFACMRLDAELANFAQKEGLNYSRYADDITLSWSNDSDPSNVLLDALDIIRYNGFVPNERKIRLHKKGTCQMVTGVVVNEKVNVPRKLIKQIRAMIHDWEVNGLDVAARKHFKFQRRTREKDRIRFVKRLGGWMHHSNQVVYTFKDGPVNKLNERYMALMERDIYKH